MAEETPPRCIGGLFTDDESLQEYLKHERDQQKLHAARFVWRRRSMLTPSGRYSWQEWWEKKFNDDIYRYAKERQK